LRDEQRPSPPRPGRPASLVAPPPPQDSSAAEALILQAFAKIDAVALGVALGVTLGLAVGAMTLFLVAKGGSAVGPNLQLLSHYFIGYSVTLSGSLLGSIYGFICGFLLGWTGASLRNALLHLYLSLSKLRARLSSLQDYIDP
jgi:hypothetical protein